MQVDSGWSKMSAFDPKRSFADRHKLARVFEENMTARYPWLILGTLGGNMFSSRDG
jgi:hypothetical protein